MRYLLVVLAVVFSFSVSAAGKNESDNKTTLFGIDLMNRDALPECTDSWDRQNSCKTGSVIVRVGEQDKPSGVEIIMGSISYDDGLNALFMLKPIDQNEAIMSYLSQKYGQPKKVEFDETIYSWRIQNEYGGRDIIIYFREAEPQTFKNSVILATYL